MSRRLSKQLYQETYHTFDHATGEETSRTVNTVKKKEWEPPFVKMYINDLGSILDLTEGPKRLMYELARRMDYEGFIALNSAIKQRIRANLPVKKRGSKEYKPMEDGTFRNHLSELVKKGILRQAGRGLYEMNPNLFARGEWPDISKRRDNFVMTVKYNASGERHIEGKFENPTSSTQDPRDMHDKPESVGREADIEMGFHHRTH